jgi:anti-sigma B factor antagonist
VSGAHAPSAAHGGPGLELTCRQVGDDVVVIAIAGELDVFTVPQARAYLQDKTAARPCHVVLDLAGVRFMGSHGVSLLVDARDEREGLHGQLHLTGVSENRPVQRTLDVTGLTSLFDIQVDQDQLLRTLSRTAI